MRRRQKYPPIVKAWFASFVAASTDAKNTVYVTMRKDQLPNPHVPSARRKCANCKRPVWVDTRFLHIADSAKAIACGDCVAKAKGVPLKAVVMDELNKYGGGQEL